MQGRRGFLSNWLALLGAGLVLKLSLICMCEHGANLGTCSPVSLVSLLFLL